jgi:hypothetical protein
LICHEHHCTGAPECFRNCRADARSRPSNQCSFIGKRKHEAEAEGLKSKVEGSGKKVEKLKR